MQYWSFSSSSPVLKEVYSRLYGTESRTPHILCRWRSTALREEACVAVPGAPAQEGSPMCCFCVFAFRGRSLPKLKTVSLCQFRAKLVYLIHWHGCFTHNNVRWNKIIVTAPPSSRLGMCPQIPLFYWNGVPWRSEPHESWTHTWLRRTQPAHRQTQGIVTFYDICK